MGSLIAVYATVVLLKWAYEWTDWMSEQKNGDGLRGLASRWWASHRLSLLQKGVLHVALCGLWINGYLLGPLNSTVGKLAELWQGDTGIASAPLFPAVTWQTTALAGTLLDSLAKPIAKRIRRVRRVIEDDGATPAPQAAP